MFADLRASAIRNATRTSIALLLSGVTFAASAEPALAALHPGDHVTVTVYDHPEISGDSTVASDGTITVALIGRIHADGVDSAILAHQIQARLERFVIDPAVEVKVILEGDSVFFSGTGTGVLSLKPGEPLLAALAEAKPNPNADLRRVSLERGGRTVGTFDVMHMRTVGTEGPPLLAGDIVDVPSLPVDVDVLGAVKQTGNVYLAANEPLGDAVNQAGIGDDANLAKIILDRGGEQHVLTLGGAEMLAPAQPGDRITVQQSQLVEVVGFVEHPGLVPLKTDDSLLSALFLAGGPTKEGDLRRVSVVHRDGRKTTNYDLRGYEKGDLSMNPRLTDGDIVYVAEQHGFDFRILFDVLLFGTRFIRIR